MTSIWRPFNRAAPAEGDPDHLQNDGTRWNLMALASAVVAGGFLPGFKYTNSVTRGEASPGTNDQPARMYFSYGSTAPAIVWVRVAITWAASGLPSKFTFNWSEDNEANYDTMRDLDGNFVLTVTYDASNNVTQMTWGTS